MAPVVVAGIPIGKLTGPWILGFMWSYFLYGIMVIQIYIYAVHFPKDSIGLKLMVALLFLLETLFTIFSTVIAYKTFGSGWGDPDVLISLDWSWLTTPILNGLTELVAQSFYVWRIYKLTGSLTISLFIESISVLSCVSAIFFGAKFIEDPLFIHVIDQNTMVVVWLAAAATCDVLITATFVIYLQRAKARTSYGATQSMLNKLLTYSIETGMLTAVMAIIELTLWVTAHQFNYHFVLYLTIARLYANALMATLNSRALIFFDRAKTSVSPHPSQGVTPQASALWTESGQHSFTDPSATKSISLRVTTEQTTYRQDHEASFSSDPKEMELSVFRKP